MGIDDRPFGLLPGRQPQQGIDRARPRDAGGRRVGADPRPSRGHPRRKLFARGPGEARPHARRSPPRESAPRDRVDHWIRPDRRRGDPSRVRPPRAGRGRADGGHRRSRRRTHESRSGRVGPLRGMLCPRRDPQFRAPRPYWRLAGAACRCRLHFIPFRQHLRLRYPGGTAWRQRPPTVGEPDCRWRARQRWPTAYPRHRYISDCRGQDPRTAISSSRSERIASSVSSATWSGARSGPATRLGRRTLPESPIAPRSSATCRRSSPDAAARSGSRPAAPPGFRRARCADRSRRSSPQPPAISKRSRRRKASASSRHRSGWERRRRCGSLRGWTNTERRCAENSPFRDRLLDRTGS